MDWVFTTFRSSPSRRYDMEVPYETLTTLRTARRRGASRRARRSPLRCCQAAGRCLIRMDNPEMAAQRTASDGRSWTTCLLLRIKRALILPDLAAEGAHVTSVGRQPNSRRYNRWSSSSAAPGRSVVANLTTGREKSSSRLIRLPVECPLAPLTRPCRIRMRRLLVLPMCSLSAPS